MAKTFTYTAKDLMGNDVNGSMESSSEQDVVAQLRQKDLFVLTVTQAGGKKKKGAGGRIRAEEIVGFARQLSTMVDAGLPILQCLQILEAQSENPHFRKVLESVRQKVEEGSNLAESLGTFEKVFGKLFVQMVSSGEAIGKLSEVMAKLADYLEASNALRKKVKSAMTYPTVVTCICLGITAFMIIHVIPVFAQMYEDFGSTLPAPTQFLITLSDFARANLIYVTAFIVAVFFGIRYGARTDQGQWFLDRASLRLPVFGPLIRKVTLSRFSNTLSVLIGSGLPILNALQIVRGVVGNQIYSSALQRVGDAVRDGENIATCIRKETVFPPMIVKMIEVGEKTGNLEDMLNKISEYYDDQVSNTIATLTSLIEPFLIMFLGVMIGGIVLCMFLPIFELVSAIG